MSKVRNEYLTFMHESEENTDSWPMLRAIEAFDHASHVALIYSDDRLSEAVQRFSDAGREGVESVFERHDTASTAIEKVEQARTDVIDEARRVLAGDIVAALPD